MRRSPVDLGETSSRKHGRGCISSYPVPAFFRMHPPSPALGALKKKMSLIFFSVLL